MCTTIRETVFDDKVCHQFDLGLLQEIVTPEMVQVVLSGCHAWEDREQCLNM